MGIPFASVACSTIGPAMAPTGGGIVVADALPEAEQLAMLPEAVVRTLAATFGQRLAPLYLAEVHLAGDDSVSTIERKFLDACAAEDVRCASTRRDMLDRT